MIKILDFNSGTWFGGELKEGWIYCKGMYVWNSDDKYRGNWKTGKIHIDN